ncbi:uracil-DNA glycosylase [Listeria grandensis FSL F6-0971]|uniref:Uracil-DNA glycosylase n=1 Tax=Listeria grandensis FSL F6-0971 TaxID=1265819 RepID=W7BFI1_9LIST|nr:uracil-DNA glycosylase [Listeria grandensis]EUJ24687.1 uracil-DNA glycosylase [Listeria grandensis FSL F6-0971]
MIQLGNDWDALLQEEFSKDYYLNLREFLKVEYGNERVYPDMYDIFNALKYTAYQDTKVVILGQDPYHGAGQAHGMSFSVKPGVRTPPSLVNMYKELADDVGLQIPNNGYLLPWAKQGVLLLNTVLTVREGKPNSHANHGWELLTDTIISLLDQKTEPVVFLLWGNNAKSKQVLLHNPNHLILTSVHPSPLSANRGFMGCQHFSKANRYLATNGEQTIDWQIPNL